VLRRILVALALLACLASPSFASKGGSSKGSSKGTKTSHAKATKAPKAETSAAPRDAHGKIKRSAVAKHEFERQTEYPHGRPGYVVDHIRPLACGGADAPSNMQWQRIAAAKAKDRVERQSCR